MLIDHAGTAFHLGDCMGWLAGLGRGSVDCLIADPPWGARRPSGRRDPGERFREIVGNDTVHSEWLPPAYDATRAGGALYLFTCWDRLEDWRSAMAAAGFKVRNCIVWDKLAHGSGDPATCWAPRHELILFGAKGRHELRSPRPVDVLRVPRVAADRLTHPYEKPVGLLARLIHASTDPGATVADPFMGSGATGEACLWAGRRFLGCEIDPAYFEAARRRLADPHTPRRRPADPSPGPRSLFDDLLAT